MMVTNCAINGYLGNFERQGNYMDFVARDCSYQATAEKLQ